MTSQVDENQPPKKRNIWKLITGLILLVALAGGLFWFFNGSQHLAALFAKEEKVISTTLPSLTVNLADRGYVKATITLEYISSKELNKEIEHSTYALKDSAIKVLRNTSHSSLQEPQSMENLKNELLQEINTTLSKGQINKLYFEEFIIQ